VTICRRSNLGGRQGSAIVEVVKVKVVPGRVQILWDKEEKTVEFAEEGGS